MGSRVGRCEREAIVSSSFRGMPESSDSRVILKGCELPITASFSTSNVKSLTGGRDATRCWNRRKSGDSEIPGKIS